MLYKCYLRKGVVYVPTVGNRRGVYTLIEPVDVVPVTNTEGLRTAFRNAIAKKSVDVPLVKGKWPPPILPKYAGVKTSATFHRGASTWNIRGDDEKYTSAIGDIPTDIGWKTTLKQSNFRLEPRSTVWSTG